MNGEEIMNGATKELVNIQNRFNKFVNKVSQEVCNTFQPSEVDILLNDKEHEQMDREGWFHPDTEPEDTRKHACSVIANRLLK